MQVLPADQRSCIHGAGLLFLLLLTFSPGAWRGLRLGFPLVPAQEEQGCGASSRIVVDDSDSGAMLNAIVNCTNGGEVNVAWTGATTLTTGIVIGSGTFLNVSGQNGTAEARGGTRIRMFTISDGGSLAMHQIKLSGGSAEYGGAIYSTGADVLVDDCAFEDNVAMSGSGGAIWAGGGALTIVDSVFKNNAATLEGGAVYTVETDLTLLDRSRFEGNEAAEGAAVYCGGDERHNDTTTSCALTDSVFVSNNASLEMDYLLDSFSDDPASASNSGGAAAFALAEVNITGCEFTRNVARTAGGAVFGGLDTNVTIHGCSFRNNTTNGYGGAISSSSLTVGGRTNFTYNYAEENGGAVYAWDGSGETVLDDLLCEKNVAAAFGGCYASSGSTVLKGGVVMIDNESARGGCIYGGLSSAVEIFGGVYTCRCTDNGGSIFAGDGCNVLITDGLFTGNVADKRGAAVHASGDVLERGGAQLTIRGGSFEDNQAFEMGGAISSWGSTTVTTISGGVFRNNTAKLFGGGLYLVDGASVVCEGATITENTAGDQGGGIYARDSVWVNSSCDLHANQAPQGAAAYVTNVQKRATFMDLDVKDNVASGSSVFYFAESIVEATRVTFETSSSLEGHMSNRAVQLDSGSVLTGDNCVFRGWTGDSIVYNENPENGSLVLDSCEFSESSATTVVISTDSDAVIRNAVVGERTFENADRLDGVPVLVDRALNCSHFGVCGEGQCVDSSLGVLCECLENNECADDGGMITLALRTSPAGETYSPDLVSFELLVSAGAEGTTNAIWIMTHIADELELAVVPSSGVLLPGNNMTVSVTGTPRTHDVGGDLTARFSVVTIGSLGRESTSAAAANLMVRSIFYFCQAFEYAAPTEGSNETISCEQCAAIDGADGLDCEEPGATLASLPIVAGYWRSSNASLVIHSCINSAACAGASAITSADDYCAEGYEGPYCALCSEGFGRGVGHSCHSCHGAAARHLIVVGALLSLLLLCLLILAAIFLIGGLDAINLAGKAVERKLTLSKTRASRPRSCHQGRIPPVRDPTGENVRHLASQEREKSGQGRRKQAVAVTSSTKEGDEQHSHGLLIPLGPVPGQLEVERLGEHGEQTLRTKDSHLHNAQILATKRCSRSYLEIGVQCGMTSKTGKKNPGLEELRNSASGEDEVHDRSGCCGFGDRIKRWWTRMPLDKLKILVVVWQILTVFPSITAVDFPPVYSRFLSWVEVVNLNLGQILSATCLFPALSFYQKLLIATLGPIALGAVLVVTYHLAKRRAGIGSAGVVARRAAWSRHVAAGLVLSFLVFTSSSTAIFKVFGCDSLAVQGNSYLRADYSVSCDTDTYTYFRVYAGLMLLVYPVGIPGLYAFILWRNRHSLNPTVRLTDADVAEEKREEHTRCEVSSCEVNETANSSDGTEARHLSLREQDELERLVKERRNNPDLVPSMFLWKDFGPDLYYYEVVECGRRILLTGSLILIAPGTGEQAAVACIFAIGSLLGFELLRPHLDPTDSWLYRLGCVVIFLSNFLALLIKVDAAGESNRDILGCLLVAVNILLVLAVVLTSWYSTKQQVDDSRDDEISYTLAMGVVIAERMAAENARNSHSGGGRPLSAVSRRTSALARPRTYVAPTSQDTYKRVSWRHSLAKTRRPKHVSVSAIEEQWRRDTKGDATSC